MAYALLLAALATLQLPDSAPAPSALVHRSGRVPRSVTAVYASRPPKVDGRLDDPVWAGVTPESGFRRDVPSDGKPAAQNAEVRVVYDREALYIGARLYDDRPELVSHRLDRRDSFSDFND